MSETVERNNRFYTKENGEIITENEQLKEWLVVANKEIERLNNIINELEKWLEERLEKLDINGYDDDVFNGIELALQKLKELKGNNKENV